MRDHTIDQAYPFGFCCIHNPSCIDHLFGPASSDETHQTDISSVSGHDSNSHFGLTDLSLFTCNPYITGEGDLTASSQGPAVDGCNHRFVHRFHKKEDL